METPAEEMPPEQEASGEVIGGKDNLRRGAEPPASPRQVRIAEATRDRGEEIVPIRYNGLREAAQSYGSQLGYARRSWEIMGLLEDRSGQLSETFSFDRVVSGAPVGAGYIVPPVVTRSFGAFESDAEGRSAAVADEYLTIARAGRISPVVPTWRDYLIMSGGQVEEPARSLLPKGTDERAIFQKYFDEGWAAGVKLADESLQERLSRLIRDYSGMLEYRRMVSLGMIDRMVLQDADFGVTGGGNEMRIGERTVQIVSDAQFRAQPEVWRPVAVGNFERDIVASGGLSGLVPN